MVSHHDMPLLTLEGNAWIRNTLNSWSYVPFHVDREEYRILSLLRPFLDKAEQCYSLRDVWKLELGDTKLWHVVAALGRLCFLSLNDD